MSVMGIEQLQGNFVSTNNRKLKTFIPFSYTKTKQDEQPIKR